jgi:hypothetical protein
MALHTKSEVSFKQYKGKRNRYLERMGKLTKHIEISSIRKFRKIKRRNRRKYLKIRDKTINRSKKIIHYMAKFKEARRQNGIKRNTSTAKR